MTRKFTRGGMQCHELLPCSAHPHASRLTPGTPCTHTTAATEKRLPFGYNALRTMYHMTKANPGYWQAAAPIKCIHFCSFPKPWDKAPQGGLEQQWWVAFAKAQMLLAARGSALALKKPQE